MAVPDFQTLMLPVLRVVADGGPMKSAAIRADIARHLKLSDADLQEMLPSKLQGTFHNRVAWALSYLKRAELLASPARSTYSITDIGRELLANPPERITIAYLSRYPAFEGFRKRSKEIDVSEQGTYIEEATPHELIDRAYGRLHQELASDLLSIISSMDPYKFEQLVLDVLSAMGYGWDTTASITITQKSADGGIDGFINQDRLGVDSVYVQAKRWQASVGRVEIQKFVGALEERRATKGIFITSSDFSANALSYVRNISKQVVLVDGQRLADLMIEFNVGVAPSKSIIIKKLDTDYFEE
ncbi:MAG: restriction endonuclease [Candidatus Kapabacteria bacterium]|nr:restriction endonuclease [Candidatus Kapabacteria bacterium]